MRQVAHLALVAICMTMASVWLPGCGCSSKPGTVEADQEESSMLTDEELIERARRAAAGINFSEHAAAPVVTRTALCTVRFPIQWPEDVLGPDYDAEVDLNCETGDVLAVRVAE